MTPSAGVGFSGSKSSGMRNPYVSRHVVAYFSFLRGVHGAPRRPGHRRAGAAKFPFHVAERASAARLSEGVRAQSARLPSALLFALVRTSELMAKWSALDSESWPRESGEVDKWIFCLTTATLAESQEIR